MRFSREAYGIERKRGRTERGAINELAHVFIGAIKSKSVGQTGRLKVCTTVDVVVVVSSKIYRTFSQLG